VSCPEIGLHLNQDMTELTNNYFLGTHNYFTIFVKKM